MHTPHLQRLTTHYIEHEDRLRLTGQQANGDTVVLWLTQRLCNRLLPYLSAWLEQQTDAAPLRHPQVQATQQTIRQSIAQQAARAQLTPSAPVPPPPTQAGWLVASVHLSYRGEVLVLTFQAQDPQQAQQTQQAAPAAADTPALIPVATLPITAQPLRQWLGIAFGHYQHAQWPTTAWPHWMQPTQPALHPAPALLH